MHQPKLDYANLKMITKNEKISDPLLEINLKALIMY